MRSLGKFFKGMSDTGAALSFIAMALGTAFFVGASTANLLEKPVQITMNTETNAKQDTAIASIIFRQAEQYAEVGRALAKSDCVLDALWQYVSDPDKTPINPNRCPGGDQ